MELNDFLNTKDISDKKDNSIKNFKTAEKQRKLDSFLQLNFNQDTKVSITNQKKMVKLDKFKGGE